MAKITLRIAAIEYPVVPAHDILCEYAHVEHAYWQNVMGKCTREGGGRFRVTINQRLCEYSYGWPYAHELGHIVLGHYVFDEMELSPDQEMVLSSEADEFAAELLMPEEWMRGDYDKSGIECFRDLRRYVQGYGVSWWVMKLRLTNLGLCSHEYLKCL